MKIEQALVLIKPDGMKKSLVGNILSRLSSLNAIIVASKVLKVSRELAEKHYNGIKNKPFFDETINSLQGNFYEEQWHRVMAFVYQGENLIFNIRELVGFANPEKANSNSIRGSYGRITSDGIFETVIHCSSSTYEAEREIKLWFNPYEIVNTIYPVIKKIFEGKEELCWL
jgi:nucleoside-diphosphate kinase